MSIQNDLLAAMKEAMKAKESDRLNVIRLMRTAIKNREIDARRELDDQEVIGVLSTLVKQRREAAQVYRDNQRPDLAEKEEAELAIVQEFLPSQLGEEEIRQLIEEAIAETGASSMRDMGKVMKIVSAKTVGRADGRVVSELVKARLA
ncbi:aspartyl-tRNA amidotransferase subunit B [Desulfuromonas versatilis]|uniref:Aspartyl-tRNA amidotransferase subunit B n=1 Tax=Desulfuromonas versatilis TaxID=2802975 RepID=A0ABN6E2M4_9BACT|nr:GatB/YqeY domain-containing protein [Desulfuromonas versatilis]BCR06497.1 aspartyl-tRNA amidotransferase subunit B [Desulfuromonas versatilis]